MMFIVVEFVSLSSHLISCIPFPDKKTSFSEKKLIKRRNERESCCNLILLPPYMATTKDNFSKFQRFLRDFLYFCTQTNLYSNWFSFCINVKNNWNWMRLFFWFVIYERMFMKLISNYSTLHALCEMWENEIYNNIIFQSFSMIKPFKDTYGRCKKKS
jgi:hypothetical protein